MLETQSIIYKSAALICDSYTKACSAPNILSGFKAAGIWPYDRKVFTDRFSPSHKQSATKTEPQVWTNRSQAPVRPLSKPILPIAHCSFMQQCNKRTTTFNFAYYQSTASTQKSRPTKPTKRKKTEHGYINSTPSLRKKKPADYSSSSHDDENAVVPVDDSSADEMDEEEQPNPFPEGGNTGRYYVVKFYTKISCILCWTPERKCVRWGG